MTINIMDQYIELSKKQIYSYMKLIFDQKYNKQYVDLFVEKYIDTRYYNLYDYEPNQTLRKKIVYILKETQENIMINHIEDRELIEKMYLFFYYVLYFDNVVAFNDLHSKVKKIVRLCEKAGINKKEDFENKLYKEMQNYIWEKENLLEKFNTDDFFIQISNYPKKSNVYRVNLKHNIKIPEVYSDFAIKKAFNMGIINEDKLIIEYYLITVQVIKDIIKRNFMKTYIVEFSDTLLKKIKKLQSLLNIVSNQAVQERICLKIRYEQFTNNKEKIYQLMRDGYQMVVILDNSFKLGYKNIENLKIFKYVIINRDIKYYNEFMRRNRNNLKNIIEI